MTAAQFTYLMGVLWLIVAGVIFEQNAKPGGNSFCFLVTLIGILHIGLATGIAFWNILF